jgi:hypothetical protein
LSGVVHGHAEPRGLEELQVVLRIADGKGFLPGDAEAFGEECQGFSFVHLRGGHVQEERVGNGREEAIPEMGLHAVPHEKDLLLVVGDGQELCGCILGNIEFEAEGNRVGEGEVA